MTAPSYGGGGRGTADRTRSNLRAHPYQHPNMRRTSPTHDDIGLMQGAGSPIDLSSVASNSQVPPESSEYAASPGADSDPYYSFPDTPATNGALSEDFGGDDLVRTHRMCLSPDIRGPNYMGSTDSLLCRSNVRRISRRSRNRRSGLHCLLSTRG